MSETIKPALTAEEWKRIDSAFQIVYDMQVIGKDGERWEPNDHALASYVLRGQPFGFTREDVRMLRDAAAQLPTFGGGLGHEDISDPELANLADRIEALLPPEKE